MKIQVITLSSYPERYVTSIQRGGPLQLGAEKVICVDRSHQSLPELGLLLGSWLSTHRCRVIVVSPRLLLTCLQAQPQLNNAGYQVSVIDYSDVETLKFALRGIDTVISTVTGPNQIELIRAAVASRVRRFAAAEFEGLPQFRSPTDPLDRNRSIAQQWLSYYSQHIQSTTFVCGILYERFQPGGLQQSRMGTTSGFSGEGDYIMNCRIMDAQVPAYDADNIPNVTVCLTAAQDVGRFVTKAIDLKQWPEELRMCGQRVAVKDLVASVQTLKGMLISKMIKFNA